MKKILSIALVAVMLMSIAAFAQADTLTGMAKGFGGELTVKSNRYDRFHRSFFKQLSDLDICDLHIFSSVLMIFK